MDKVRDIILSDQEQMQFVELIIEGKKRKFYIGNAKEHTVICGLFKHKKIKLNLIEM